MFIRSTRTIAAATLLAAAGLATTAQGQTITLTDGNATLQIAGAFDTNNPNANLITDTGAVDVLSALNWYYRQPNNNQNRFFGFFNSLGVPSITYPALNKAVLVWNNTGAGPTGSERMNYTVTLTLTDGSAPGAALVTQEVFFQSSAANTAQQTFQVFNNIDLDLGGAAIPNTATIAASGLTATYTQAAPSTNFANIAVNPAPTRFQADAGSVIRSLLNGGSNNLSTLPGGSGSTFAGDAATAFQWQLVLNPGESRTLTSTFAINQQIPQPCYANCDGSTDVPVLGPADFSCFLTKFRGGDAYANCDGSTDAPVLGPADFSCFLTKFRAGC